MPTYHTIEDEWLAFLTGEHKELKRGRKIFRLIPSHPRCKWCSAPFGIPGKFISQLLGKRPERKNPNFCNACFSTLKIGGAEIELSFLFADVRGSTALAERIGPAAFRNLLNRFYGIAVDVLLAQDALVDKFVGDEVIGLFIPALSGKDHANRAIEAAQELLRRTGHGAGKEPWLPIGAGVHTGIAFVGAVGDENGVRDLTALGDPVNTAARLASVAAAGEILVSDTALSQAGIDAGDREQRNLALKGKSETVAVHVLTV
ncbi:MAG: adenylate/guanylate cyclase domain-containing protein [Candidatus Sungbacteria bacterium]|nr:adenylate/guanylate cyclase domain-containing protein [Candidatus Sungbacteria bacterium]